MSKILVTAALPYANGPIHVGHAIGCYVPADVYTRYHRLRGDDVIYICGSDEHGTPISVTADKEGIKPKEVVEKYRKLHEEAFKSINIRFTNYSGTSKKLHHEISQDFFKKIDEKGHIFEKTVNRPYCPSCKRFLPDRYVHGICPKCDSPDERGDQCERCGVQLEPHELKKPYCSICGKTPENLQTKHWFFRLSELGEKLKPWVEKNTHWPVNARNFALGWLREGLQDRAITRDLNWGISVPKEGAEGKVLYVWFDAPIGYISSTVEWSQKIGEPEKWRQYWQDEDSHIIHFIGKDNIPFHTIIWPATLLAYGGYNLPYQIASNEYLNLEGKKMSTSRGWVLWLKDCTDSFDPEALRYYLLSITPQNSDSDFSLTEFQQRVNSELISTLGNLVNRVGSFIKREGGIIPEPVEFTDDDLALIKFIRSQPDLIAENIEKLNFINALSQMMNLAHEGNRYFQKKEPWKNPGGNTLYLCANLLRSIAIVASPFLPATADKIWAQLALEGSCEDAGWESSKELGVKPGHRIGEVTALFKRIEDEEIEEFAKKHLKTKAVDEVPKEESQMIDFESFNKVELKVARIVDVKDHPNADKLLVLTIDVGEGTERTLVAGIKAGYGKEELIGKKVIVVANLKPASIRGVESQGMILAAEDKEGNPILLIPDKDSQEGTRIR